MPTLFGSAPPGPAAPPLVGLYGKIPAQGDFLRLNAASPVALAFDTWLQESIEMRRRASGDTPPPAFRFFFRSSGQRTALVGVSVPSVDKVGRRYPLTIFAALSDLTSFPLAALPLAFAQFLDDAEALAQSAGQLDAAALSERAKALCVPTADDMNNAALGAAGLCARGAASDLQQELFGAEAPMAFYGWRTFLAGCESARGQEPARPGITLVCPARTALARVACLALATRVLRWSYPPSCFWNGSHGTPDGRLLISASPPSVSLLGCLATGAPPVGSTKVWPLTTSVLTAVEEARQSLSPEARAAIEATSAGAPATVEQLLFALGGEPR